MTLIEAKNQRDNYSAQADRWYKRAKLAGKGSKEHNTYDALVAKFLHYSEIVKTLRNAA